KFISVSVINSCSHFHYSPYTNPEKVLRLIEPTLQSSNKLALYHYLQQDKRISEGYKYPNKDWTLISINFLCLDQCYPPLFGKLTHLLNELALFQQYEFHVLYQHLLH